MERVPTSILERRVFIDTSAFFALTDRQDRFHAQAVANLERLERGRYRLLTTPYVVVETHAKILKAAGPERALTFVEGSCAFVTRVLVIACQAV